MANWSNPQLTSTYTNFVTEVKDRDVDLALQFDGTTSTNLPTGTIRWSSSANRWQKWSGSSWGELTNTYQLPNITISGVTNAGTLLAGTADITAEVTCGRVDVDSSSVAVNGMYLPSTNTLGFATGGTAHYYIDSSGNLLYGRSTARTDVSGRLQLEGTGSTSANILLARNQNVNTATGTLNFVKNHAASTTNTALTALSYLGQIGFWGANGTSYVRGVTIYAYADGAWSGSANPTGINIDTTGGGRISLGSTGNLTLTNLGTNNVPVNLNGSAPNNALVLDASGNLGLGVVPKAWGASFNVLDFAGASFASNTTGTATFIAQNAYYDSAWKYKSSTNATLFQTDSGSFQWYTSTNTPSVNGAITFTQAMTLDASGNLGLGVTPSAWISSAKAFQFGSRASVFSYNNGTADIGYNLFLNSSLDYVYLANTQASFYRQASGQHQWLTAPSGTAGAAITFTQAMTLDASGRLLVGTTSALTGGVTQYGKFVLLGNTGDTTASSVLALGKGSAAASGDTLGQIYFTDNTAGQYAFIGAYADAATGAGDMPGRLVFSTTADGAATPTEELRITNDGVIAYNQIAPAAVDATATLTVANLKAGIITSTTAAAVTMTLPTGTLTEGGFSSPYTNMTFEWSVINTGATNAVTVQAGTDHTLVGSGTVAANNSGRFATRRTAANTWVTYRLSS